MNRHDMSGSRVGGDDEVIKCDIAESGLPSREGGQVAEMLEVSDERILMVVVHVRDDTLFHGRFCCCW